MEQSLSEWANPFAARNAPLGQVLEPEGYGIMRAKHCSARTIRAYGDHMPSTLAIAREIYYSVPWTAVWGEHCLLKKIAGVVEEEGFTAPKADVSWRTYTEGKWRDKNPKKTLNGGVGKSAGFPMKAMEMIGVVKALASPDHFALGNKDTWSRDQFYESGDGLLVRHLRIDIDLDLTFHTKNRAHLAAQVAQARAIFAAFNLTAQVMITGNRGIQVIAPTPYITREYAHILTHMIRHVLKSAPKPWRAADYKSALTNLMRLPLGRHALWENLAVFVDDNASVLPAAEQGCAAIRALRAVSTMDAAMLDGIKTYLGIHDFTETELRREELLFEVVKELADDALVVTFLKACDSFRALFVIPNEYTAPYRFNKTTLFDDKCDSYDLSEESGFIEEDEIEEDEIEERDQAVSLLPRCAKYRPPATPDAKRIRWDKTLATKRFSEGYGAGESYHALMNKNGGKNLIGMALIICDGDVEAAIQKLIEQAQGMPANRMSDVEQRIALIRKYTPLNNTRLGNNAHKELKGELKPEYRERAEKVVEELVRLRAVNKLYQFRHKALEVIKRTIELMLLSFDSAEDGVACVSYRTIAYEIGKRWPETKTNRMDVKRYLEMMTEGEGSLISIFTAEKPSAKSEAMNYRLNEASRSDAFAPCPPAKTAAGHVASPSRCVEPVVSFSSCCPVLPYSWENEDFSTLFVNEGEREYSNAA